MPDWVGEHAPSFSARLKFRLPRAEVKDVRLRFVQLGDPKVEMHLLRSG